MTAIGPPTNDASVCVVDDVALRFGGVVALDGVSFHVEPGELFAIIGPNGAGKTSTFNCLNGVYRPQQGRIDIGGDSVLGASPTEIARRGVARTFQNLGLFDNLDVVDNLMLGRHLHMRTGFLSGAVYLGRARREEREHRAHVAGIVEFLGLDRHVGQAVGTLPYGVRKRIELGRALAMDPTLLLLDEPVAGMNRDETAEMAQILVEIRRVLGVAMILIEHDMHLVMDLADRVMVLNFGVPVATGTPAEIQSDPEVIAAYLGTAP